MCGICGYNGSHRPELLKAMCDVMAHRGPDDFGVWHDPKAQTGFGHRRLSIIDLSPAGRQPMTNEDKTIWLICNGEIYNYRELTAELKSKGHIFHSQSDSEVLLHLYEEEGKGLLERLNGIFAFAIWDGKKQELFLARDALGVKPLYYSEAPTGFFFASELKALLMSDDIPREIDFEAVAQYLTYLWAPAPHTMLKHVRKMKPGQALIVSSGKIVREWAWYRTVYDSNYLKGSEQEICEELVSKIQTAVKRQLMSDVPLGAFLSGGLDSSTIVTMMRRLMPEAKIDCYSIGFDSGKELEGSPVDLPYAKKVADFLKVNLHEIRITPQDLIRRIQEFIYFLDEPQADPAPINAMLIARKAREHGIKVLLSGAGGDDIFSGYRRHLALEAERYYTWLPLGIRKFLAEKSHTIRIPGLRRVQKIFASADLLDDQRMLSYFQWSTEQMRRKILSPDVRRNLERTDVDRALRESLKDIPRERSRLNRMLYLETRHFLADHNLNYTDKTSMRYGVEVRVPFLDTELVEFAAKIPPRMKQHGWQSKAILKKAMSPYLPKGIVYRRKTGFGAPLRQWIKGDLNPMVMDLLSQGSLKARGLFDPTGVHDLIRKNLRGQIDGAYTIFSLLCMEIWCRRFLDRSGTTPEFQK